MPIPSKFPPGPAGFAPQLVLSYSSSEPNERHSSVSPAGDVGDGWTLSLGSISMQTIGSSSPASGNWYFLNDVAGVSDRLVPGSVSGFYETQHISHLRIQQITVNKQPCFQVWDKDGTFYEFGCTSDSLEYWTDSGGTRTNYLWNLDRVIAPNENAGAFKLMLITYQQDLNTINGQTSVRDSGISKITYGYSASTSSIDTVVGTIDFSYLAPPYSKNYNCDGTPPDGQSTTLRCDDPIARTNGGITVDPPLVMSTRSLQSVTSYVGSDSNSAQKAYRYDFSYDDLPFGDCNDDYTQYAQYCAGEHLLTSVTPTIYQNGTAHRMPPLSLSYTTGLHNTYYDSQNKIQNGTGQYSQQTSWRYLSKYVDTLTGVGGTVQYNTAYSNTHGTPNDTDSNGNLDDRYDPLHCSLFNDCSGNYAHPDDHAWSVQVVTSITALGSDSSSLSPARTSYSYRLAKTGTYSGNPPYYCYPAGTDSDCVGDNWILSGDNNWLDYYDAEFRGFNVVTIAGPASGEERVDSYYSTKGWNTASSDGSNYDSGHLYEEDVYGIYGGTQEVLLSITQNQYTGSCPLSTPNCATTLPNACNGSLNSYYNPCEVMVTASRTTTYDTTASNNSSAPWVERDYTYDDYNINSTNPSGLGSGYHNLTQDVVSSSNAPTLTQAWTYWTNDSGEPGSGWIYYTVDKVKSSQISDASGKVWQCQHFSYDEGASSTPDAGWLTTSTAYSDCANQSGTAISSVLGYDKYGNLMASVDGIGVANPGLYSSNGCSFGTGQGTIKIISSSWTASHYTSCSTYTDGGSSNIYESLPLTQTYAFGFQSSISYDYTQAALPLSSTDINGQTTSLAYSFDSNSASNGKYTTSVSEPGETGSYTTQSNSYSQCSSSSTLPCFEIDSVMSQYSSAITRTFYDSLGREVETRTPGPGSYDTIVYTLYNDQSHSVLTSVPFQVASGSSWIDPIGAKDDNGNTPGGTAVYYDAPGRSLAYQDPSSGSTQEPGVSCSTYLSNTYTGCTNYLLAHPKGDTTIYEAVQSVDANSHSEASFNDALGRTRYTQWYNGASSGSSGLPANSSANEQETVQYNALNEPTSVVETDLAPQTNETITSVTTSASYDSMGRITQLVDPDRGTHSSTYSTDNWWSDEPADGNYQLVTAGAPTGGWSTGPGAGCSFTAATVVATLQGERAIGQLNVGDEVLAYNPRTHRMEAEPILHVWIRDDHDLIDLVIMPTIQTPTLKGRKQVEELVHTTSEHPFLTEEAGFVAAGRLQVGMHVLRADGTVGVVVAVRAVPGSSLMYNLEIAQDHTFTVGNDQWIVHNSCE